MQPWLNKSDSVNLDAHLKAAVPAASSPAGLHEDIMLAVRNTRAGEAPRRSPMRWLPTLSVSTAVIIALGLIAFQPRHDLQALQAPAVALEQSQLLAQSAPATAVAPMSTELDSLKQDLTGAVQFVIASIP